MLFTWCEEESLGILKNKIHASRAYLGKIPKNHKGRVPWVTPVEFNLYY